jgi:hypothetical protein
MAHGRPGTAELHVHEGGAQRVGRLPNPAREPKQALRDPRPRGPFRRNDTAIH